MKSIGMSNIQALSDEELKKLKNFIKKFLESNPESDRTNILIAVMKRFKGSNDALGATCEVLEEMEKEGLIIKKVTETYSNMPKPTQQEIY